MPFNPTTIGNLSSAQTSLDAASAALDAARTAIRAASADLAAKTALRATAQAALIASDTPATELAYTNRTTNEATAIAALATAVADMATAKTNLDTAKATFDAAQAAVLAPDHRGAAARTRRRAAHESRETMIHTRPSEPFGARDDIADAERQRKVMKHREEQAERLESEQRAQQEAAARAREDGSPPTVLGRVMIRQFESSMLVELADRLPGVTLRLLLPVGARWDPSSLSGMFKTLGAMLNENIGAVNDPTHRFWQLGVIDVNGGGSTAMPTTVLAVGEPLYRLPAPVAPAEPSDEERASAVELAREAVEVLSPTKARARDLAASLRAAIATGPHAIETLALVLEQRAGVAPTDETEPPRAA